MISLLIATVCATEFIPKSFRVTYRQIIVKKISGKTRQVRGVLDYRYPGKVRFEQSRPEKIIWVSNQRKAWFYQAPFVAGESGQLKITSAQENPLAKFFDLLSSKRNYRVVEKSGSSKEFIFSKKEPVSKAVLEFKGAKHFANLKSIQVVQSNGRKVKLLVDKIALNTKYPAKYFSFHPPKNTRISK